MLNQLVIKNMDFKLSIEENKDLFHNEMITFEKRFILQHYFKNKIAINDVEREILKTCPTNEIEPIALIGALLGDTSPFNVFRLRIGSIFKSDKELARYCQGLLTPENIQQAEDVLFHWEYEYNHYIEEPIVDYYIGYFKEKVSSTLWAPYHPSPTTGKFCTFRFWATSYFLRSRFREKEYAIS